MMASPSGVFYPPHVTFLDGLMQRGAASFTLRRICTQAKDPTEAARILLLTFGLLNQERVSTALQKEGLLEYQSAFQRGIEKLREDFKECQARYLAPLIQNQSFKVLQDSRIGRLCKENRKDALKNIVDTLQGWVNICERPYLEAMRAGLHRIHLTSSPKLFTDFVQSVANRKLDMVRLLYAMCGETYETPLKLAWRDWLVFNIKIERESCLGGKRWIYKLDWWLCSSYRGTRAVADRLLACLPLRSVLEEGNGTRSPSSLIFDRQGIVLDKHDTFAAYMARETIDLAFRSWIKVPIRDRFDESYWELCATPETQDQVEATIEGVASLAKDYPVAIYMPEDYPPLKANLQEAKRKLEEQFQELTVKPPAYHLAFSALLFIHLANLIALDFQLKLDLFSTIYQLTPVQRQELFETWMQMEVQPEAQRDILHYELFFKRYPNLSPIQRMHLIMRTACGQQRLLSPSSSCCLLDQQIFIEKVESWNGQMLHHDIVFDLLCNRRLPKEALQLLEAVQRTFQDLARYKSEFSLPSNLTECHKSTVEQLTASCERVYVGLRLPLNGHAHYTRFLHLLSPSETEERKWAENFSGVRCEIIPGLVWVTVQGEWHEGKFRLLIRVTKENGTTRLIKVVLDISEKRVKEDGELVSLLLFLSPLLCDEYRSFGECRDLTQIALQCSPIMQRVGVYSGNDGDDRERVLNALFQFLKNLKVEMRQALWALFAPPENVQANRERAEVSKESLWGCAAGLSLLPRAFSDAIKQPLYAIQYQDYRAQIKALLYTLRNGYQPVYRRYFSMKVADSSTKEKFLEVDMSLGKYKEGIEITLVLSEKSEIRISEMLVGEMTEEKLLKQICLQLALLKSEWYARNP